MFQKLKVISYNDAEEYLTFYRKRKWITDEQWALKQEVNQAVLDYVDRRAAQSAEAFRKLGCRPATKGAPPATGFLTSDTSSAKCFCRVDAVELR